MFNLFQSPLLIRLGKLNSQFIVAAQMEFSSKYIHFLLFITYCLLFITCRRIFCTAVYLIATVYSIATLLGPWYLIISVVAIATFCSRKWLMLQVYALCLAGTSNYCLSSYMHRAKANNEKWKMSSCLPSF